MHPNKIRTTSNARRRSSLSSQTHKPSSWVCQEYRFPPVPCHFSRLILLAFLVLVFWRVFFLILLLVRWSFWFLTLAFTIANPSNVFLPRQLHPDKLPVRKRTIRPNARIDWPFGALRLSNEGRRQCKCHSESGDLSSPECVSYLPR